MTMSRNSVTRTRYYTGSNSLCQGGFWDRKASALAGYDTIRRDNLYLCAPKSRRTASLVCRTEPTNKNSNEEN